MVEVQVQVDLHSVLCNLQNLTEQFSELVDDGEPISFEELSMHISELDNGNIGDWLVSIYKYLSKFKEYNFTPEIESRINQLRRDLVDAAKLILGEEDSGDSGTVGDPNPPNDNFDDEYEDIDYASKTNVRSEDVATAERLFGKHELVTDDFGEKTILAKMGYHVGYSGQTEARQRQILKAFMQARLLSQTAKEKSRWGQPNSSNRRDAVIRHHKSQISLAEKKMEADFSLAIKHWTNNIEWLEENWCK